MNKSHTFTLELQCNAPEWWRYNTNMACVTFDEQQNQTGFYPIVQRLAEVGVNLMERPEGMQPKQKLRVESAPCAYAVIQLHIIPHSLPLDEDVWEMKPLTAQLKVWMDGEPHSTKRLSINRFGGLSLIEELRPKAE